jgi:NADH-quinone oxidoreductase subunit F
MNIPRFLQLYKENRLDEALESVIIDNPLPSSTGRVCQHPCESRCRRASMDASVNMREVHRFIADSVYESDRFEEMVGRVKARRLPDTGKRIAIVGAGPTGLTAAFYLRLLGHQVTVYESKPEAGGMLRYALPEYRLPRKILKKEIELIERLGINFVYNVRVGFDITLNDLDVKYDGVFLGIGTWKEAWLYLPGTELKGVLHALPFLESVARREPVELGPRVVVIGGGNAAIDSARTALRLNGEVNVIYRRERKDMPAIKEETDAAAHEGARFTFLATPHRIIGDENGYVKAIEVVKTKLGEFDKSGRRRPISTDETMRVDCDTVILAVGESVDLDFARASGLKMKDSGTVEVDRFSLETSRNKFYAGGDVITGASNVSNAMGYGKKAARTMDTRLMGAARFDKVFPEFSIDDSPPVMVEHHRHDQTEVPAGERVQNFSEAVVGLNAFEALEEAARCLRCDLRG